MNIIENKSLLKYNTFNVDVNSEYFIECNSKEEIKGAIKLADEKILPPLILGGGSNILFTKDFEGVVIKNSIKGIEVIEETDEHVLIKCGAGEIWDNLVEFCVEKNFGGIENLSLIPGTVGAAPIQNIGAYGAELKDVFYSLTGVFLSNLQEKVFYEKDCKFGYRCSIFKDELKNKFVITEVVLKLTKNPLINTDYSSLAKAAFDIPSEELTIKKVSELVKQIRRSKLPDTKEIGNAGSFFKNPIVDKNHAEKIKLEFTDSIQYETEDGQFKIPAGWLIEKCGLKGMRVGDSGTYDKQALVLVNHGKASGQEIYKLAEFIRKQVSFNFNINLEAEVNII